MRNGENDTGMLTRNGWADGVLCSLTHVVVIRDDDFTHGVGLVADLVERIWANGVGIVLHFDWSEKRSRTVETVECCGETFRGTWCERMKISNCEKRCA